MKVFLVVGCWLIVLAATGSIAKVWSEPRRDLTPSEAADIAIDALTSVGFAPVLVTEPVEGVHVPVDPPGPPVDSWDVVVEIDREEIELKLQRNLGQILFVDDVVGADRSARLLTEEQFRVLDVYRDSSAVDDQIVDNVVVTVASAFAAAVAMALLSTGTVLLARERERATSAAST